MGPTRANQRNVSSVCGGPTQSRPATNRGPLDGAHGVIRAPSTDTNLECNGNVGVKSAFGVHPRASAAPRSVRRVQRSHLTCMPKGFRQDVYASVKRSLHRALSALVILDARVTPRTSGSQSRRELGILPTIEDNDGSLTARTAENTLTTRYQSCFAIACTHGRAQSPFASWAETQSMRSHRRKAIQRPRCPSCPVH